MVKVRLVENSVNNNVGKVMVVKVMSQSNNAGMSFAKPKRARPSVAIELLEGEPSWETARPDPDAIVVTVLLMAEWTPVDVLCSFPM